VGTLVAEFFADERSQVGVILGTGSNACYWEKVANISKFTMSPAEREACNWSPAFPSRLAAAFTGRGDVRQH
jgi:hexokinase